MPPNHEKGRTASGARVPALPKKKNRGWLEWGDWAIREKRKRKVNGVFQQSKPGRSVGGASHTRHLCENKRGHPRPDVAPFLSCAPRP